MSEKRIYFDMGCSECQRERDKLIVTPDLYEEVVNGVLIEYERGYINLNGGHDGYIPAMDIKAARALKSALGRAIKHAKQIAEASAR